MRRTARLLRLAAVLVAAGSCLAASEGARAAQEQTASVGPAVAADDLSGARRFGGRKVFASRAWRGRLAERAGKRPRRDRTDEPPGKLGDDRPDRPVGAPQDKPDPRDHARRDDRDDRTPGGADRPPRDRDPDGRPRPPQIDKPGPPCGHLVCIGGRVRDGACACDGARVRLSTEQRIFRCQGPQNFAALAGANAMRTEPPRGAPPDGSAATPGARRAAIDPQDAFVPDEVLVTPARGTPESADDAVGRTHGLVLIERRSLSLIDRRIVRYRIQDGRPLAAVVTTLRGDPRVLDPQPNYLYRLQEDAAAPRALALQYALARLDALRAQALARGRGVLVAVIDTGMDASHPDLAGAIVDRVDATDVAGPRDPHATAVGGIIAANGLLRGVAPDARLLDVRAFAPGPGEAAAATTVNLLRGIEWAVARQARVLNMSFTGPKDALLERAIVAAGARGAIMVAAAGNGGAKAPFAYPAAYPQVIAVTAIDAADRLYAQANQGRYIAVAAPGVDILTASAEHAHRVQSGTSFAAPHVSGILALMLERDPSLTADAARHALMTTAHDLGPPGPDDQFGVGRPDAVAALAALAKR
jgi:subtilisin family serine protease